MALAVGRIVMGVTALATPSLIWRPWVGDARGVHGRVLGRAPGWVSPRSPIPSTW
jgi:hypothetical protein